MFPKICKKRTDKQFVFLVKYLFISDKFIIKNIMTIKHTVIFFTSRRNPLFISQCLCTSVIFTKDERQGTMTLLPMIYAVLFEIHNPSEPFGMCLFMISPYLILQPTFFSHTANRLLAIILETYTMIFQNTQFIIYILDI